MGKPTDLIALERYRQFLLKWGRFTDCIQWKSLPLEWIYAELPNLTVKFIHEQMCQYVSSGGQIDQVEERRPEFVVWRFHYDLRLPISNRKVYIETVFEESTELEDCTIWVVNVHDV